MQDKNSFNDDCFNYTITLLLQVARNHFTDLTDLTVASVKILRNISNSLTIGTVRWIWKVLQLKTSWKDLSESLRHSSWALGIMVVTNPSFDVDMKAVSAVWSPMVLEIRCFQNVFLCIGILSVLSLDPKEFPQFLRSSLIVWFIFQMPFEPTSNLS